MKIIVDSLLSNYCSFINKQRLLIMNYNKDYIEILYIKNSLFNHFLCLYLHKIKENLVISVKILFLG